MIILRAQIVRVIVGSGKIGWEETIIMFDSLGIFALSLFAQAIIQLYYRAFWALHDSKTPFISSFIGVVINIFLSYYLSAQFGILGLIAAFSTSSIITAGILHYFIGKRTNFIYHKNIANSVLKISIAAIVAGLFSQYIKHAIEPFLDTKTGLGIMTQGLVSGIAGLYVYCLISEKIGIEEYLMFKNSIRRRLFKTKVETAEIISEE